MKRLMMLGGGIMQIPALKIARKRGWKIFLADGNRNVEGKYLCDVFLHIDLKDKDSLLNAAREIMAREGLDGVFTAGTDFSTSVAWIAENLNLPGIPYSVALGATDKSLMRKKFKDRGVPCPDFISIEKTEDIKSIIDKLPFPLVVKPVDNMGARGVRRVDNLKELKHAVKMALKSSRKGRAIIETYMEGPELSYDAIVYKGEVTICGIADRHIYFSPYFVEMGHTMPSNLPPNTLNKASEVFISGIKALEIDNGAAKGDIKITEQGPMVGEIAARLSGGYMSGWTFPYSSGVDLTGAALNIAVGLPPGNLKPLRSYTSAERAFISIPGRVKEIEGIEMAKSVPGIRDVFLRIKRGDDVTFPANNVEKCGNVISLADSRENAICSAMNAVGRISILLEEKNRYTDCFLFGNSDDDYFSGISAYELTDENNREFYMNLWWKKWVGSEKGISKEKNIPDICIAKFPFMEEEEGIDWHGLKFTDALTTLVMEERVDLVEVDFENESVVLILGKLFWKAFLKGGIQGARYVIETVRKLLKEGEEIEDYFDFQHIS